MQTTTKRIFFECQACGYASVHATRIVAGDARGAFICPRCQALNSARTTFFRAVLVGAALGIILGAFAILIRLAVPGGLPAAVSVAIAAPLVVALAWWLAPFTSRFMNTWHPFVPPRGEDSP
jgi:hypothetical protein